MGDSGPLTWWLGGLGGLGGGSGALAGLRGPGGLGAQGAKGGGAGKGGQEKPKTTTGSNHQAQNGVTETKSGTKF